MVQVWEKPADFGDDDIATVAKSATHTYSSAHQLDYDNIALMDDISEPPLLALLKRRLLADQIYTWTGDVLISVNPYFFIDGLYDTSPATMAAHAAQAALDDATALPQYTLHRFSAEVLFWRDGLRRRPKPCVADPHAAGRRVQPASPINWNQ